MAKGASLLWTVAALCVGVEVEAFNLHPDGRNVYQSAKSQSAFGFSVAFHEIKLDTGSGYRLVVGAPREKANSIRPDLATGAAYECDLSDFECRPLTMFDVDGEFDTQTVSSFETEAWLGATIVSRDGHTLVCAPRATDKLTGKCYVGRRYESLETGLYSVDFAYVGGVLYCQRGFSAAISRQGRLFMGAPSCKNDSGSVGRVYVDNSNAGDASSTAFESGEPLYFSHAVAAGLPSPGRAPRLASSVVTYRGTSVGGKVVVLDEAEDRTETASSWASKWALRQRQLALDGHQAGELFGGALAYADVDGDGVDELLVGAPLHSKYSDAQLQYEIGAVYVYKENSKGEYGFKAKLSGSGQSGARFGASLAAIGDVNGDGYDDVAVGAPYDADGAGCVHVFHGSVGGLRVRVGQIVCGRQFQPPLRGFGFAVAGGADVDGNGYADVAVGAHLSDAVILLPARPVVRLQGLSLAFKPETLTNDDQQCNLTLCVGHGGLRAPPASVTFLVEVTLDAKRPRDARMLFADTDSDRRIELLSDVGADSGPVCRQLQTYIRPGVRNKHTPIEAAVEVRLVDDGAGAAAAAPVLDAYGISSVGASTFFDTNCGPDKICVPDLQLQVTVEGQDTATVVQGSESRGGLAVDVQVDNKGEDAFESEFFMELPESVDFVRYERDSGRQAVTCSPSDDGRVLRCDLGSPLVADDVAKFKVWLETRPDVSDDVSGVRIACEANSTNGESAATSADNRRRLTLTWDVRTSLDVAAQCRPETLTVNYTSTAGGSGGNETTTTTTRLAQFVQFYEVRSAGPSDIVGADVTIFFATRSAQGVVLSRLLEPVQVQKGSAECETDETSHRRFAVVRCRSLAPITSGQPLVVRLSAALSTDIVNVFDADELTITSNMTAVATRLPFGVDTALVAPASTTTTLRVTKLKKRDSLLDADVEWWVYAASSAGALVVLALFTVVLWKCGFFARSRPQDELIEQDAFNADGAEWIEAK